MALINEDGTGLANAESYAAVADADTYHTNFNNPTWAGLSTPVKEQSLRRATQYIDSQYSFRGIQLTTICVNGVRYATQSLAFPRTLSCYPLPTLPTPFPRPWPIKELVQATCELALRAATGVLNADHSSGDVISEQVGSVRTEYAKSGLGGQTRYILIDQLLKDLTGGGLLNARLERA